MKTLKLTPARLCRTLLALTAALCSLAASAAAQQTPGGTVISNQASATYTDGTNTYNTSSNTVTVTVANVSGLVATPDAQSNPAVVPGQTGVDFVFTVTNTGNFTDQVRFLASGASVRLNDNSLGTITAAVLDNGDNVIGAGDTDVFGNGADVLRSLAQNGSVTVIVRVSVSASAPAGQTLTVFLGDSATDNVASNSSANELRTVSASSVNGTREAVGSISAAVQNDVQLRAVLTAPAGPIALGSNITYTAQVCNDGNRPAVQTALGSNNGVFIVVPVPVGTALSATNSFPAGTLYTTSALTTAPQSATWTTTAPAPLSSTTRVAFNAGATLAGGGTCSAAVPFIVAITATNATTPIYEIMDVFARNSVNALTTDQSGDALINTGDGNANYDEPLQGQTPVAGKGIQLRTLLQQVGGVLLGPIGFPGASGPSSQNDDFTERSVNTGIAGVAPGGATTAGGNVVFVNTLQNTGNANDTFTITATSVPTGFTVEVRQSGIGSYTTISGAGSFSIPVAFGASVNLDVRVSTTTGGQTVLTGFPVVLRATSGVDNTQRNDTIDRYFTGFVRLNKTATVTNSDPTKGGTTDAVPGADIEYVITYTNVMTPASGGNSSLAATNVVITENGSAGTNNWAATTDQVVGSASDTNGGSISGDTAGSTVLTDTITTLSAGSNGTFRFKRKIK